MGLDLLLWCGIGIMALGVLVKAADVFMVAAEKAGSGLGLSPFIIGISIVALGTSLPELASSIASVFSGASEIAVATVVGSNITNILLILGIAGIVGRGLRVQYELVRVDLPFLFGSALLLTIISVDGGVHWPDALLALATFGVYLAYTVSAGDAPGTSVSAAGSGLAPDAAARIRVGAWTWIVLVVSGGFIHGGAVLAVESVLQVSALSGIQTDVLAASVIAIGTSLPELTVTIRSAAAGKPEVAVGNVIGSNVFNALGVVGAAGLFGPLVVSSRLLEFAFPVMIGATVLCFFVLQERELTRWDGWLMLAVYVAFSFELYGLY